jgi:signal transduction histidine kinase
MNQTAILHTIINVGTAVFCLVPFAADWWTCSLVIFLMLFLFSSDKTFFLTTTNKKIIIDIEIEYLLLVIFTLLTVAYHGV